MLSIKNRGAMNYIISELKCSINRKNRRDRDVPPIGDRLDIPV